MSRQRGWDDHLRAVRTSGSRTRNRATGLTPMRKIVAKLAGIRAKRPSRTGGQAHPAAGLVDFCRIFAEFSPAPNWNPYL